MLKYLQSLLSFRKFSAWINPIRYFLGTSYISYFSLWVILIYRGHMFMGVVVDLTTTTPCNHSINVTHGTS